MVRRDTGPETVVVYPERVTTDAFGNTVRRPGDPLTDPGIKLQRVRVQPVTTQSDASQGLVMTNVYRILCGNFPGGARSVVQWRNEFFFVQDEPQVHRGGRATAHDTVYMHSMGPLSNTLDGG